MRPLKLVSLVAFLALANSSVLAAEHATAHPPKAQTTETLNPVVAKNEEKETEVEPRTPGTLRLALLQPMTQDLTNPFLATDSISQSIAGSVHATLFALNPLATKTADAAPIPLLAAANPSYFDAQKRAVIQLRRDIRYSDGTRVTASDFARTLKRSCLPNQATALCPWVQKYILGFSTFQSQIEQASLQHERSEALSSPVAGILVTDDSTLELRFTEMNHDVEWVFSSIASAPIHPNQPELGAGAFVSRGIDQKSHRLVLVANPKFKANFFPVRPATPFSGRALPLAKRIEFLSFASRTEAAKCLKNKECDWVIHSTETFFAEPESSFVTQEATTARAVLEWNPNWLTPRERDWIKTGLQLPQPELKRFLEKAESIAIKKSVEGVHLKLDVAGLTDGQTEMAEALQKRIVELGMLCDYRVLTPDEAWSRRKSKAYQLLLTIQTEPVLMRLPASNDEWTYQSLIFRDSSRKDLRALPLNLSPARWLYAPAPKN